MLSEGKIDSLDTHLEQFKLNDQTRQNDLQDLLREYGQLLEDHKVLKKAFELKASKPAVVIPRSPSSRTKPRETYVLILVDGNSFIFNDELIKDKEEGGMRAARLLNEAVEKYLHHSVPAASKARIVVRIYADVNTLSKQLSKSKVVGPEKRSMAAFSAAFTRAIGLFDFVDALDEEGTKFKIREHFKLASEDDACSHVFFAACHNPAYLSLLVPFSGMREKITLVQGAGWNQEFDQFNLNVTQFPTVFRWSEVPTTAPPAPTNKTVSSTAADPTRLGLRASSWRMDESINGNHSGLSSPDLIPVRPNSSGNGVGLKKELAKTKSPCRYFQKGTCRLGDKCPFSHNGPRKPSSQTPTPTSDRSSISTHLPKKTIPGFIPVNALNQRLDPYIRPPTNREFSIYQSRFHQRKPCNSFHLQQSCTNFDCTYDHSELEPQLRHVMSYILKCTVCPRRSECRIEDCYFGHICQKEGCKGHMKGCRMKGLHDIDPRVGGMVPAERGDGAVAAEEVNLIDVEENGTEEEEEEEDKEPSFYW